MTIQPSLKRTLRERESYNLGLQREGYNDLFSHCKYFYTERRHQIIQDALQCCNGKTVLEIGSSAWAGWIEANNILPSSLHCINISESELQRGISQHPESKVKPNFQLMDAHQLEYEDETFDVVFGRSILHHLNFDRALQEIHRVLKPQGKILFVEPLGINPVGKLVRALTPFARTIDEKPFIFYEINQIRKRFDTRLYFDEFLSVPFGVLSRFIFKNPNNWLMHLVFNLDKALSTSSLPIRYLYRSVIIMGTLKPS